MEIRWLGNFTFEVRSSVGVVIVDYEGKLPNPTKVKDANTVFVYSSDAVSYTHLTLPTILLV